MVGYHASTICAVRRSSKDICIGSDGQITKGETITKNNALKVGHMNGYPIIYGCAGTLLDTAALVRKFENQLIECDGDFSKALETLSCILQTDISMRDQESLIIAADENRLALLSGSGELLEPENNFVAIGSGGNYAYAAANALYNYTDMDAEQIVRIALKIASSICVYTNANIVIEKIK